jgi:hypothetical protein
MIELLKQEGLTDEQITLDRDNIIRTDDGFISWRIEHGYPFITHALIYPEKRGRGRWLDVYMKFNNEMKSKGFDYWIAEVIPGKDFWCKYTEILGSHIPYATNENGSYYLIRLI